MVENAESTIVGESILITGSLNGDEDLTVLGRVEGSIDLSRTLVVAETGVVKAEVSVRNAIISGIVVGNITASDSVEVTESGRLVGDIRAPRVIVVAGARVRGAIDMGDLDSPRPSGPLPSRTLERSALTRTTSIPTRRPPPPSPPPRRVEPAAASPRPSAAPRPTSSDESTKTAPSAPPPAKTEAPKIESGAAEAEADPKAAERRAPMAARKIKKKVVVKKKA